MSHDHLQPPPHDIRDTMSTLFALPVPELKQTEGALDAFYEFRVALETGEYRAAQRNEYGAWITDPKVKEGILVGMRLGVNVQMSGEDEALSFVDKATYPARRFAPEDEVRVVPGGTSIRSGSHIDKGVIVMPPAYVNVGAYIGKGTMLDSHSLVGSCAQVGENAHISAGAQIGGVLEPINANPCIVEDEVIMGANTGIFEGTILRRGAVLAPGVNLTRATRVFDTVNGVVYQASEGSSLEIPENAVVVPGVRMLGGSEFELENGLGLYVPVIRKYRDESTNLATALEASLR